jgi:hypothetical protein
MAKQFCKNCEDVIFQITESWKWVWVHDASGGPDCPPVTVAEPEKI